MDSFNLLKELTNLLEFSIWKCSLFFFCAGYLKLAVRFQQLFFGYLAMQSKIFFLLKHMCHCQRLLKLETNFSLLSFGQKKGTEILRRAAKPTIYLLFYVHCTRNLSKIFSVVLTNEEVTVSNKNPPSESSGATSPTSTLDPAMFSSAMTTIY